MKKIPRWKKVSEERCEMENPIQFQRAYLDVRQIPSTLQNLTYSVRYLTVWTIHGICFFFFFSWYIQNSKRQKSKSKILCVFMNPIALALLGKSQRPCMQTALHHLNGTENKPILPSQLFRPPSALTGQIFRCRFCRQSPTSVSVPGCASRCPRTDRRQSREPISRACRQQAKTFSTDYQRGVSI